MCLTYSEARLDSETHSSVSLNLLCCGRLHSSAPCCTSVHDGAVQCTPGITCLLCKQNRKQCLKGNTILVSSKEIIFLDKRETQDALGRWFYPSQKFRIFFKNIPDSRIGFFLGMESGGDVKFFSPGAPV